MCMSHSKPTPEGRCKMLREADEWRRANGKPEVHDEACDLHGEA